MLVLYAMFLHRCSDFFQLCSLPMHLGRDFQAQGVQADEAGGVVLVVGLGRVGFHRGGITSPAWAAVRG